MHRVEMVPSPNTALESIMQVNVNRDHFAGDVSWKIPRNDKGSVPAAHLPHSECKRGHYGAPQPSETWGSLSATQTNSSESSASRHWDSRHLSPRCIRDMKEMYFTTYSVFSVESKSKCTCSTCEWYPECTELHISSWGAVSLCGSQTRCTGHDLGKGTLTFAQYDIWKPTFTKERNKVTTYLVWYPELHTVLNHLIRHFCASPWQTAKWLLVQMRKSKSRCW